MSGTSMDGLDIADVLFNQDANHNWKHEIIKTASISYPNDLLGKLKKSRTISSEDLLLLDKELGHFFAEKVKQFIIQNEIDKGIFTRLLLMGTLFFINLIEGSHFKLVADLPLRH